MKKINKFLSKSTFIRGCQCVKSLWLHKYKPELRDEISDAQEAIFQRGTDVGRLARNLFPSGYDASPDDYSKFFQSIGKTRIAIENDEKIIYEAAFTSNGLSAAIDILVKKNGKWFGYEVKSSTSVSETYLLDAAFQYFVIKSSSIDLQNIFIVYLNTEYIRHNTLDLKKLFNAQSVKKEVLSKQSFVKKSIENMHRTLCMPTMPEINIGLHCSNPYPCDFQGYCWRKIPENSIFELTRFPQKKMFDLFNQGVVSLKKFPASVKLSKNQIIQIDGIKKNKSNIDIPALKIFLTTLSYPLYFFDFETFMPAVPLYKNSRPYQQIPFQYSLHYKKSDKSILQHRAFLGDGQSDPREALIRQFIKDTGKEGDIIVYNQSFEKTRLAELARDFPKYKKQLNNRIKRIKDLLVPFQQKLYYTPSMNGSASIKSVLPALVPSLSYKNLDIGNGGDAMAAYQNMVYETNKKIIDETRNALLKYCHLDTLAMVKILEKLMKITRHQI